MKKLQILGDNKNVIPLRKRSRFNPSDYEQILDNWLGRSRSKHTKRVYRSDINDFFREMANSEVTPERLADFFSLEAAIGYDIVSQYRNRLVERELSSATVNRKLAAITSLVNYGAKIGKCNFTLTKVERETVTAYRDTSGIDTNSFKKILATCDLDLLGGLRDYAILLLLWGNALRRSEIVQTNIEDVDLVNNHLRIIGKGRSGFENISLGKNTARAIANWLSARKENDPTAALFTSVHKGYWGHRLTVDSIYMIVKKRSLEAGVKTISPHKIRHSSITAALDATEGDVRRVQKLSRHKNINTLLIYDDNRKNLQAEVTGLLEDLL